MVDCPICGQPVRQANINVHIDSGCEAFVSESQDPPPQVASFFRTPASSKKQSQASSEITIGKQQASQTPSTPSTNGLQPSSPTLTSNKRPAPEPLLGNGAAKSPPRTEEPPYKRPKTTAAQRAQHSQNGCDLVHWMTYTVRILLGPMGYCAASSRRIVYLQ